MAPSPFDRARLAQALWQGPLPDPAAPAQDLMKRIEGGTDYKACLQQLATLCSHGVSTDAVIETALATWPWSIDLALLAVEAAPASDAVLDTLERRIMAQNRRYATLAWARWGRGDATGARRTLTDLDPGSGSFEADRVARAELAILCDDTPEPIAGPEGLRLSLLQCWRRDGAAPLARRVEIESAGFPAAPTFWAWLIEVQILERDFDRAEALLARFSARCGADHPEVIAQTIRIALDREDPARARALLAAQIDPAAPWLWSPRQHVQHLRCARLEAMDSACPDHTAALDHARRAARLYPRNEALRGALFGFREMIEDWDALASDAMSDICPAPLSAWILGRIGCPEAALDCLRRGPALPPDAATRLRFRATDLHLRSGDPAKAEAALGPEPAAWSLRADHAWWRSEIALKRRDAQGALEGLGPALALGPTRLGLILNAARATFLLGAYDDSLAHLARFHALKTAQLGAPPADDLRDLITRDAAEALTTGGAPDSSPGLAARAFALNPPAFRAALDMSPIPRRLAHYWEGPRSAPVTRGIHRWAALHPDLAQTVYDAKTAQHWLTRNTPDLAPLFARLSQPAARADLFRVALIATEGGVFADLDEYPRAPVTPWLEGARAVLVIEEGYGTIANNFLAALPGLPLFTRLAARIAARLATTETPYAWWDTGPAQITVEALRAVQTPTEADGLLFLSQAAYDARVSTNLPFPHKRGALHWRQS